MTLRKYKLYDWAMTVEIQGRSNSVFSARRVLIYLLNSLYDVKYGNGDPVRVWSGSTDIARNLGVPRATVCRALKRLEDQGIMRRSHRSHWVLQLPQKIQEL